MEEAEVVSEKEKVIEIAWKALKNEVISVDDFASQWIDKEDRIISAYWMVD